jgi:hypothetical protein
MEISEISLREPNANRQRMKQKEEFPVAMKLNK